MRLFDIILSLIGLILLLPLLFVIGIVILIDSNGPAIFSHTRVGKNLKHFKCYKLRTMYLGSDKNNRYQTEINDDRITPFGRYLRKYSIDELPQLYNVIKGDMSLVGPRPDTPFQETLYKKDHWVKRHKIRPGITGLAQLKARHIATHNERLRYDLYYIDNLTLKYYFYLIFSTLSNLFKKYSY